MGDEVPRPANNDDRDAWCAYWQSQGMPWRTESEVDEERQAYLAERRAITPDIQQGIYPFKDIKLTRADMEWLLGTHESGGMRGPVVWKHERNKPAEERREGLDLRGSDLHETDLSGLPLARARAGLTVGQWYHASPEQQRRAGAHVERAILQLSHLERASFTEAHLETLYVNPFEGVG